MANATLDLNAMWNFRDPAGSEARFVAALANASHDEACILKTQIARTHGLRGDFSKARALLAELRPSLSQANPEARVRYHLELARTYASAAHKQADISEPDRAIARDENNRAIALAQQAGLDGLAIDAIHMMAFVDTAPAEQLRWARDALKIVLRSKHADATRWEASIRNNMGVALNDLKRHDQALREFELVVPLHEKLGNADNQRIARWMIARTLRYLNRTDDAIAIQLQLEREWDAVNQPDAYVFEELVVLYRSRGEETLAGGYQKRLNALTKK